MPEPTNSFPPWIIPIITAILGYIVALLIERFKNRKIQLKWKRNIFQLAKATQHAVWGNIEVRHNDRPTNQLSFITYELKNDSNIDLEKVNVNFWCDADNQILNYQGHYIQSGDSIKQESEYAQEFNEVIKLNIEEGKKIEIDHNYKRSEELAIRSRYILSNVKFNLPVFNRNTSVKFQILAENFKGEVPQISLSALHKSCDVVAEENEEEKKNKENKYAGVIWLILLISTVLIIYFKYHTSIAVIWTGVLSLLTLYLSIGLYRLLLILKKIWR